ncbi:MAG TPA: PAS domain-containing protein [Candidatus Cybelea sp.]|nr:PAS domain-containing protein [Candidatus Cybelea sp.]
MPDTGHPAERRLVLRLLNHWREIAGERAMPSFADLRAEAMPDMWPHCYVLELKAPPAPPLLKIIGASFADEAGLDLIGKPVSSLPADTLIRNASRYWDMVMDKRVPVSLGGEFKHRGGHLVLYRSIILPLSANGAGPDHLLGGANCRVVVVP